MPTKTARKKRTKSDASDRERYLESERTFLASEGVEATSRLVELERLGGSVRVLEAGEGPPVVLVPGVMTGGAVFAGVVDRLPDYRCIMLDRPGVGLSPLLPNPPTDEPSHERVADDLLVDLLDALDIERSHVVSTSMGGYTAFRSIAAHPDRFLRLVGFSFQVGAPVEKMPLSMKMPPIRWLTPRRVRATPGLVRRMLKSAGMRAAVENGKFSDELLEWMASLVRHTDTFGNESFHSPRPQYVHSAELLGKVAVPVHLFWGSDDYFGGSSTARTFASMLPNATLQIVEGTGHAPWIDEPDLAAQAAREHLAAQSP